MGVRLRLADVEQLSRDELVPLITEHFDNLVTVAVAESTNGYVPQQTRRLLRTTEWRQEWHDALQCAAGELQVAAERMRYLRDPCLEVTEHRLRRVRARGNEAAALVRKSRRHDFHESAERAQGKSSHRTAQGWLRQAFPEEHAEILRREQAERNVSDEFREPSFRDVHEQIAYACARGLPCPARTPDVDALLAAGDTPLRLAVADDAKRQESRTSALRHPLLLGRWDGALTELGSMTVDKAWARTPNALGALPETFYACSETTAIAVLNARRFLAAVQQRRLECKRCVRQYTQAVREWKRRQPHVVARSEAKEAADEILRERRPFEYAYTRARLLPYEERPGSLPDRFVSGGPRAELKARVGAALTDGSWKTGPPRTGRP